MKVTKVALLISLCLTGIWANNNYLMISSSEIVKNQELQFARPFKPGAFKKKPKLFWQGGEILYQMDVKQKWPDGSLKHAIFHAFLPELTPTPNKLELKMSQDDFYDIPLTVDVNEFLKPEYDFDAKISIKKGEAFSVSARDMLENGFL